MRMDATASESESRVAAEVEDPPSAWTSYSSDEVTADETMADGESLERVEVEAARGILHSRVTGATPSAEVRVQRVERMTMVRYFSQTSLFSALSQ